MKPLLTLLALLCVQSLAAEPTKPNLVFILADDLGWRDLGCFGSTFHQTPNLDKLAARGLRFTHAYAANPLCSPTRASVLTGLWPARIGITAPVCHLPQVNLEKRLAQGNPKTPVLVADSITRLKTDYTTLPEVLRAAGYKTGHFGKWHLGPEPYSPLQHGFDVDWPHWSGPGPAGSYVAPWKYPPNLNIQGKPGEHIEDTLSQQVADFIRENKDRPFFVNYWMFSVHAPYDAKDALVAKYRKLADANNPQRNPLYAAMVESLDAGVGRVLTTVEQCGLMDKTVIVFFSDNGGVNWAGHRITGANADLNEVPITSNAPLRGGKASLYEGGTREPCIVVWPGVTKPGTTNDTLIQSIDWMPTLLDIAGLPMPAEVKPDGLSLVPVLQGGQITRDTLFCHFPHDTPASGQHPGASVRRGDWKLIRLFAQNADGSDQLELYDLKTDLGETKNLAAEKPELVRELNAQLDGFLKNTEAAIPKRNPAFKPDASSPKAPAAKGKDKVNVAPAKSAGVAAPAPRIEPVMQLTFADSAGFKAIGKVTPGIALTGEEAAASLARGGDGKVARFEGGRLLWGDATPVFQGLHDFTLSLRLKSEGDGLHGTVLAQRQPGRHDSGGFDVSGWPMPFIERQHFGFQGMFEGGLLPNAAAWSPAINVDLDQHPVPVSKWRDVVLCMTKGGPLQLYLDGRLVMERLKPSAVPGIDAKAMSGAASPLCIGSAPDGSQPFHGWVDEVALWNRALNDAELQKLSGVSEITKSTKPRGDRVFGTGVLTPDTTAAQRYAWIDARLPAFREHLEKSDPHFPRYHLTLPGEQWNRIGFFHKGRHHLFFGWTTGGCFRYFDDALENIVWQHLVSEDLIHWTILPMPIRSPQWPNENGTFFVNDAGEVVTFYYGDRGIEPRMAVSRDPDLIQWEAFPDRVRFSGVPDEFKSRHDPSAVFKKGDTWHLVCTTVRPQAKAMALPLYQSKDLIHWEYAGKFFEDSTGRPINECGQLFRLGGRDVFTSIHPLTKNTTYMTGHVRQDGTFARETGGVPDLLSRSYNDVSSTVDDVGRVTMWRFCNVVRSFRDDSAAGWRNTYSLARDVRMASDGRLLFRPAGALEKLRGKQFRPLTGMNAAQCEVRLQFTAAEQGETGIHLTDGRNHLDAYYDHAQRELVLDCTAMPRELSFRVGSAARGPVNVRPGEPVTLRFFSDRSVFELYANDEVVVSSACFFHEPDKLKVAALHRNGPKIPLTVEGWEMQPLRWSATMKP